MELGDESSDFLPIEDTSLSTHFIDMPKKKYGYPGQGGDHYEFAPDGHGSFQDVASLSVRVLAETSTFTWSIDQEVLHIAYGRPRNAGYPLLDAAAIAARIADPALQAEVLNRVQMDELQVPREVVAEDISFVWRGEKIDQVVVREQSRWHFDEALLDYGIVAPIADF